MDAGRGRRGLRRGLGVWGIRCSDGWGGNQEATPQPSHFKGVQGVLTDHTTQYS